jgi:hypothetical protein
MLYDNSGRMGLAGHDGFEGRDRVMLGISP